MIQGYSATIKNNQIHWLDNPPVLHDDHEVVVMVIPKTWQATATTAEKRRSAPQALRGLMTIQGDIIDVPEMTDEWELQ